MQTLDGPDSPTDMAPRSWAAVLKRTVREFKEDDLTDLAAALTYYGVLAIFRRSSRSSRFSDWSDTPRPSR